jgi:hypothetical protein
VFENYVELLQIDDQAVELSLWDTAGAALCGAGLNAQDKRTLTDYARCLMQIHMSCACASL